MRAVAWLLLVVLGAAVVAMLWQHRRYVHARRAFAQDEQPLLHSGEVFHVVTFLELAPGADLFESVRKLRDRVEAGGAAKMVYAGKVALNAGPSRQLVEAFGEAVEWDAIVLVQYPSREAWEGTGASETPAGFARSYSHGMQRAALPNLLIPQAFLATRLRQLATRAPARFPFEAAPKEEWVIPKDAPFERLTAERELVAEAAVVVNLQLPGSEEQRDADRQYVGEMFELMAEMGNGPLHMGRAVTLEKGTRYENVAIVYYPGVEYFRSMIESRFYQGIIGRKQLGDNQSSITVPILHRL
ncbi:MAG: hypothetical protein ABFS41_11280 [Myxococcota bacterium]